MGRRFVVGLDVGQTRHPTAIAIVEALTEPIRGRFKTIFEVRRYGRLPLGTGYMKAAEHVSDVLWGLRERAPESHPLLRIDATGVGAGLADIISESYLPPGCPMIRVKQTGTDAMVYGHDGSINVGNLFIASRLQALMQTKRLRINAAHLKELADELQDYQLKIDQAGRGKFQATDQKGSHGDRVVALALAVLEDGTYEAPKPYVDDGRNPMPFAGILNPDRVGF